MNYSQKYLNEANLLNIPVNSEGEVGWQCASNIALVKYWGKRAQQLPMNPSLSLTLNNAFTQTKIQYVCRQESKAVYLEYYFDGNKSVEFAKRINLYLNSILDYIPVLSRLDLKIVSENTFPHSSGIASSASSFGALALCLLDIERHISGSKTHDADFYTKASFLARLGSGSAARSLFGGLVEWGINESIQNSSDEIALSVTDRVHDVFRNYHDIILLIDVGQKTVSSSLGHEFMHTNPYSEMRFKQARTHLSELMTALQLGDVEKFIRLVEDEALSLHGMMLTSSPGYFLVKPNTLEVIDRIRNFRKETGSPVCFTLDAGANVHLLFPPTELDKVLPWVENELKTFCHEQRFLHDWVGSGPKALDVK